MSIARSEFGAVGDGRDDLVTGRGADRGNRTVVGRLCERDDELAFLEVDRQRQVLARDVRGDEHRRVLVDRRVEEVDEADPHVRRERGGEVLAADEPSAQQHGRQRQLLLLCFVEGVFEVVTREHVAFDERLSEPTGLTGQHPISPAAPAAGVYLFRIGGPCRVLNPPSGN